MTVIYPGALWLPIHRNYTPTRRKVTRGVILHVAAGEARSLRGWFNNPAARASSHLYIRRDGTVEQYVDLDQIAWTSGAASNDTIGVETQGMGHGEWTPAQVNALIEFIVWAAARYRFPIRVMASSKASERGVGWHAQGVPLNADQKRRGISQTGGQLWSSAVGKICPGPDRIKQIPGIVAAAAGQQSPPKPAPSKPNQDIFQEDDMALIQDPKGNVYASNGITKRHVPHPSHLADVQKVWGKIHTVSQAVADSIPTDPAKDVQKIKAEVGRSAGRERDLIEVGKVLVDATSLIASEVHDSDSKKSLRERMEQTNAAVGRAEKARIAAEKEAEKENTK